MKSHITNYVFILFSFLLQLGYADSVKSQDSEIDSEIDVVTALTPIIKFSVATFKNNVNYEVKTFGIKNGTKVLISTSNPLDTFIVEIKDYDSLKFYSKWSVSEHKNRVVDHFIQVAENQKFEFFPVPVFKLKGVDIEVSNSTLKTLAGNKLYEVTIKDDVNSSAVEVFPLESSAPYIDVIRIDTVTYQIMLKNKDEFIANLTDAQIKSWSKGEELSFPIGILMIDRSVPDDEQTYQLYLKKKKKAKKKTA